MPCRRGTAPLAGLRPMQLAPSPRTSSSSAILPISDRQFGVDHIIDRQLVAQRRHVARRCDQSAQIGSSVDQIDQHICIDEDHLTSSSVAPASREAHDFVGASCLNSAVPRERRREPYQRSSSACAAFGRSFQRRSCRRRRDELDLRSRFEAEIVARCASGSSPGPCSSSSTW